MKKIIFAGVIVGIILGVSASFFLPKNNTEKNPNEEDNVLEKMGYSIEEIAFIETLNNDKQDIFKDEYITYFNELLKQKYFISNNYEEYIKNYDKYEEDVIEIVNANRHFEYYLNINKSDLTKDHLVLVNKYFQLDENYEPTDLNKVTIGYGYLRKAANDALIKMNAEAKTDNINLYVTSSFRPYSTQERLYNNYVNNDGVMEADRYSARPGHSEHQTGLAIDFIRPGGSFSTFHESNDFEWLIDNAYKYGFILRYPENKEDITGFMYESWHYRYVGEEIALYIHENKITYDEYYAYYLSDVNEEN